MHSLVTIKDRKFELFKYNELLLYYLYVYNKLI